MGWGAPLGSCGLADPASSARKPARQTPARKPATLRPAQGPCAQERAAETVLSSGARPAGTTTARQPGRNGAAQESSIPPKKLPRLFRLGTESCSTNLFVNSAPGLARDLGIVKTRLNARVYKRFPCALGLGSCVLVAKL